MRTIQKFIMPKLWISKFKTPTFNLRLQASMRTRLLVSFSGILLIFIVVALFNLYQVKQIERQLTAQNNKVEMKLMAVQLKELVQEMNIIAAGLELSKDPQYINRYNEKRKVYEEMVKKIGDTASDNEQRTWRSQLISASADYLSNFDAAARMIQDPNMKAADLNNNLVYLYGESQKLMESIFHNIDQFYNVYNGQAQTAISETGRLLAGTSSVMLIGVVVVLILTVAIAFALSRSFMGPIRKLQRAVHLIASGDLRITIDSSSRDELGELSRSFDLMILEVKSMLAGTKRVASSLSEHSATFHRFSLTTAAANSDILHAIEEMTRGTLQQAAEAERSAVIITELEGEMHLIADYANRMLNSSEEASLQTRNGTEAVEALRQAALQSQDRLLQADTQMDMLQKSSGQIGQIIRTITDISTQTHVLALNAAIEAARAGVHGRGFAVIAEEVRKLAGETNQSSKMITEMITSLQGHMSSLQAVMSVVREKTDTQNAKVADTFASFGKISTAMDLVAQQIQYIHEKIDMTKTKNAMLVASIQQTAAIAEETAAGVEQVGSTASGQDASIRRIANDSDDIRALSLQLFEEISRFQIQDEETVEASL